MTFLELTYTLPDGKSNMNSGHAVRPQLVQGIALVRVLIGFELQITLEGGASTRFYVQEHNDQDGQGVGSKDQAYCIGVWREIQAKISAAAAAVENNHQHEGP